MPVLLFFLVLLGIFVTFLFLLAKVQLISITSKSLNSKMNTEPSLVHINIIRKPLPVLEEAFFLWILEAADDTERGEQGRESGNNHLDDCLDDVLLHRLKSLE